MPESSPRSRNQTQQHTKALGPNPVWYKPVMFGLMTLGLLWIITFYITSTSVGAPQLPVPGIGPWNIAIGFGIIVVGFLMTTRWR